MPDGFGCHEHDVSTANLESLHSEFNQILGQIETIDSSLCIEEPEWILEVEQWELAQMDQQKEVMTLWGRCKQLFKKEQPFNLNSGASIESVIIRSSDFALFDYGRYNGGSPTFGNIADHFESYISDFKSPCNMIKGKYQMISLMSEKRKELRTPRFEEMGKGPFSLFLDCFRRRLS